MQGQQDVDPLYGTMLFVNWQPGDVVYHKITDLRTGRVKYGRIVIAELPEDPVEKYFPKDEGGDDGGGNH